MLKIYIFLLSVSRVFSLKCHICKNADDPLCFELTKANGKFLRECRKEENECAVLQEKSDDPFITRRCVTPTWKCDDSKYKCGKCNTDGCNNENEVKQEQTAVIIPITDFYETVKANTTPICIISLLVVLTVIWGVTRCYSRRKRPEYEDDCDEYYVNETNIDME